MNIAVQERTTNLEWLGQQMRAKTTNYETTQKGTNLNPITWEDRCGAIASIEDKATKAYCEILVWGDYRDTTMAYNTLHCYLATALYEALVKDVQRVRFDLKSFALKVAKMALFFKLRGLQGFTVQDKLKFSGIIEMKADTYRRHYIYLENMVEIMLSDMQDEIDYYVDIYRKNLKKA
ncbi:hypothetical protein [Acinetobacter equi]|uniref:Uncharacterized protein n=1 Tax=Acinetobacter equi TaxID=1324350 RepID=A0A0N9W217_9GAMM|nr:hypothetical protein [Acinetobacter equi]ALH95703.1 hypothetical protein AOY20_09250 [Acinetobacter equi]